MKKDPWDMDDRDKEELFQFQVELQMIANANATSAVDNLNLYYSDRIDNVTSVLSQNNVVAVGPEKEEVTNEE